MAILSAFADEVTDDFQGQISFLASEEVHYIELRFLDKKNVVDLTHAETVTAKRLMDDHNVRISAVASPIGKIRIDEPFEPHLEKFKRAIERAMLFQAPFIRIFSYYPPAGKDIAQYRTEVIDRMHKKVELLKGIDLVLVHENETHIYGSTAERCVDLMTSVNSPHLRLAYDPANFVWGHSIADNVRSCWPKMKPYVVHVHVKDWKVGESHIGSLPGQGDGQIPELLAELSTMKYDGFLTVEPHLKSGGQFGGETGPELFSAAIRATRVLCLSAGLKVN
jgi:sugar phosphate isomerase/epimerase